MIKYRISVIIRIVLLMLLGYLAMHIALETYFWMSSIWVGAVTILLVFELIRYIERERTELQQFLESMRQNDFSYSYVESISLKKGKKSSHDIKYAFNEIMRVFRKLREEQAENHAYLQTIVKHVKVALLCFDEDYSIQLINDESKELFQTEHIYSAKSLKKIDSQLYELIVTQKSGQKQTIKLIINNLLLNLSVRTTEFVMSGKKYKLFSFQDIKSELDVQEIESWQKLIRVITHEIRNSAIPIATLSGNLAHYFSKNAPDTDPKSLNSEDIDDLKMGLDTIANRSKGLVNFVESTSKFTRPLKNVDFKEIFVKELFVKIISLLQPKIDEDNVHISITFSPKTENLKIKADKDLIEQTIINLMLNSIDALKEQDKPKIVLSAIENKEGVIELKVTDNGKGISAYIKDNIFVPFYSTKENGSGIGLSFSRQVMHLHKGSINFKSIPFEETSFSLMF